MQIRKSRKSLLAVAAMMLAAGLLVVEPASAQLLFDWGGQEKPNDSGRIIGRLDGDTKPGEIVVSFGDRRLYLVTAPGQAVSYPIAIPREQDRWQGRTTVTQKRENPSWTPTPTMIKENPKLPRWVPGGHPMNPLGVRALYLGSSFYRIHGTDAPWTIGSAVSKGCIRMYNKDAQDLYERVKVGAKVLVTWNTYKFTPNPDQPQLPQPKEEPAAAAQVSAAVAGESTAQPPARSMPARFDNPFDSGPTDFRPRRERQEPTEPAEKAERETQQQQPATRPARNRPAAEPVKATETESRPARTSRGDSSIDTGSLGERRQSTTARPKTQPVAVEPSRSRPAATTGDNAAASVSEPDVTAAVVAPAAAPRQPEPDASEIAARALAAAERAAAAAERAAAAAERAARVSADKPVADTAPAARPEAPAE